MTRTTRALATLGVVLSVCAVAQADDETAKKHYRTAIRHWRDPDPAKTAKHLAMAIEAAESKLLRLNLFLVFGQFHQGKTGDFKQAGKSYDRILKAIPKTTDPRLLRLKSAAYGGQAAIEYTTNFKVEKALPLFVKGHELFPSPETADNLSQLYLRMARSATAPAAEKAKHLAVAHDMALDSIRLDAKRKRRRQAWTAKLRLQHVIVLTAMGQAEKARAEYELIDVAHFSANTDYQEALLLALQNRPGNDVGAKLRQGLSHKARPGLRARNQYRGMIRTEPDFAKHLKRKDWKDLVTDEAEPTQTPTTKPTTKPADGKLGD